MATTVECTLRLLADSNGEYDELLIRDGKPDDVISIGGLFALHRAHCLVSPEGTRFRLTLEEIE